MDKKKDNISILIYVAIAYGIGYFGFYLWFVLKYEWAGFIAISAPATAYFVLRKIRKDIPKVDFKNISVKSVILGAGIPILYTVVSVIMYVILKGEINTDKFSIQTLLILIVQWVFAGFCEEVGWRGFLFPTLKKWNRDWTAYVICGLIWSGWHLPMIFSNTIMTSWSHITGILLLCVEAILMCVIIDKLMQMTKRSIWTSILFHAAHNMSVQLLLMMVPNKAYALVDDGGYLSILVLVITTCILLLITRKKR